MSSESPSVLKVEIFLSLWHASFVQVQDVCVRVRQLSKKRLLEGLTGVVAVPWCGENGDAIWRLP